MTERLVEDKKELSFWDAQKKTTILTFANMKKVVPFDKEKKLLVDPEVLFPRLFAISQQRDIDLRTVLQYELAAVLPSLFNADGSMRKTVKSDLAKYLESNCEHVYQLPPTDSTSNSTLYIIDGMAMVQSLNESQFQAFNDLGEVVIRKLLKIINDLTLSVSDVAIVFDRYDKDNSIKAMKCSRRGGGEILSSHVISGARTVPNYKQFFKSSGNKASIADFISFYVEEMVQNRLPSGKSIILSGGYKDGQIVKQITQNNFVELNHLFSSQEEADTRVILHAAEFCNVASRIIIRADNNDVLVLLLSYNLFLSTVCSSFKGFKCMIQKLEDPKNSWKFVRPKKDSGKFAKPSKISKKFANPEK